MKYLLDTHALLWVTFDSEKLSKKVKEQTADPENQIMVSSISFWELSLKFALNKIKLSVTPEEIATMVEKIGIDTVNPRVSEYATIHHLPAAGDHKDPFDRIIIWQAIKNDWSIISKDSSFKFYEQFGLKLYW
jgi:PIN domain nuclease of toxin-antitoxin system